MNAGNAILPARAARGLGVCVAVATLLPALALAQPYTATDLFTLQVPGQFNPNPTDVPDNHYAADGQVVGDAAGFNPGDPSHALLFSGPNGAAVDLTPAGYTRADAVAVAGMQQVGNADFVADNTLHALLWNGTADSFVDLNPVGFENARAVGVGGGQQVGYGNTATSSDEALLWSGSAASAVNLQPSGYIYSRAIAVGGGQQVGSGWIAPGYNHAMLWSGTADSAVDLNPAGFTDSYALGVGGGQQVGYAIGPGANALDVPQHAMLWSGTADSAVDLSPPGFSDSVATGVADGLQVGIGISNVTGESQALLWFGSADQFLNLNSLLPPGQFYASEADSIDASGNVFGLATDYQNNLHAIEWSTAPVSVPEPASVIMLFVGAGLMVVRRRKSRHI